MHGLSFAAAVSLAAARSCSRRLLHQLDPAADSDNSCLLQQIRQQLSLAAAGFCAQLDPAEGLLTKQLALKTAFSLKYNSKLLQQLAPASADSYSSCSRWLLQQLAPSVAGSYCTAVGYRSIISVAHFSNSESYSCSRLLLQQLAPSAAGSYSSWLIL